MLSIVLKNSGTIGQVRFQIERKVQTSKYKDDTLDIGLLLGFSATEIAASIPGIYICTTYIRYSLSKGHLGQFAMSHINDLKAIIFKYISENVNLAIARTG